LLSSFVISGLSHPIFDETYYENTSVDSVFSVYYESLFHTAMPLNMPGICQFYNIGYDICETDDMIRSVGLCMESSIEHTRSFYATSLIGTEYDEQGNTLNEFVRGVDDTTQMVHCICTDDGGYVACGGSYNVDSVEEQFPILVKFDENFDLVWKKEFDMFPNALALSVAETDDGFIVSGLMIDYQEVEEENSDIIVFETNLDGELIWKNSIEINGFMFQYDIIGTSDDGYIIAGDLHNDFVDVTTSHIHLVKIDEMGIVDWMKPLNYSEYGGVSDLIGDNDQVIIAGYAANLSSAKYHSVFCCIDNDGDLVWDDSFQFEDRLFFGLTKTTEGYAVTGHHMITESSFLMKLDESRMIEWGRTTDEEGLSIGMDVIQTDYSSFCFTGYTVPSLSDFPEFFYSEMNTVSVDSNGNEEWKHSFIPLTEVSCDFSKNRWVIENTGRIGAYNLSLTSQIEGNIFGGVNEQTGQFMMIPPGEQQKVNTIRLFGLGKVTLELLVEGLNIDPTTCSVTGFLIGPFFFKT
jgi:hypothetical protein